MLYYTEKKDDKALEEALLKKAELHPVEGFWKAYGRLRLEGYHWNHKRVYRVYKKLGLSIRRKAKKRLPARPKVRLEVPSKLNHTWSIDFTETRLENGSKVRCFNVIDDANREMLHIEVDRSLKSRRIIWVLNRLVKTRAKPKQIRMDNGPEFIAHMASDWSKAQEITFMYIQPGKPTQNAFIERFNGSYRRGVLRAYIYETMDQLREQTQIWMDDYNNHRPHDSLKRLPPVVYAKKFLLGASPQKENQRVRKIL